MIKRRAFITLLGGAAAAYPLAARAQQPVGKVWRIAVLETTSAALNAGNFDGYAKRCGSTAMSRAKTSSLNTFRPMAAPNAFQGLRRI